jgi:hypothetical protein
MNNTVRQAPFSLTSKYEIETPGAIYSAKKAFTSLGDKVELFSPHGQVLATLRERRLSLVDRLAGQPG